MSETTRRPGRSRRYVLKDPDRFHFVTVCRTSGCTALTANLKGYCTRCLDVSLPVLRLPEVQRKRETQS